MSRRTTNLGNNEFLKVFDSEYLIDFENPLSRYKITYFISNISTKNENNVNLMRNISKNFWRIRCSV